MKKNIYTKNINQYYNKIIYIFILTFQISWGQEVSVIDNKGTIGTVRNNQVITSTTEPTTPLEGDVWYDNTDPSNIIIKIRDLNSWKNIDTGSKTIILDQVGGSIPSGNNTYYDLKIENTTTNIKTINPIHYQVVVTGTKISQIKILQDGNYLISTGLSVSNLPKGDIKYILAFYVNGILKGYINRGFVSTPLNNSYWGASGTIMYPLEKNDLVKIQYVVNAGGRILNAIFSNIGITKI